MSTNFKKQVEDFEKDFILIFPQLREFGKTGLQQEFCILVTKDLWWKVRVFVENGFKPILESDHWTRAGVEEKIYEVKRTLRVQ
ncbi:unnamed protein product, partial [Mesorhabditis belari]|uniref:Uncharacterized protein n=1 Tax=Mesorhabditis belari TaxID=2138241 RepID=A0AAF3FJH6_9BILA